MPNSRFLIHCYRFDHYRIERNVREMLPSARLCFAEFDSGFDTRLVGALAECGVVSVQIRHVRHADKELRRRAVFIGRTRHGYNAELVRDRVV